MGCDMCRVMGGSGVGLGVGGGPCDMGCVGCSGNDETEDGMGSGAVLVDEVAVVETVVVTVVS